MAITETLQMAALLAGAVLQFVPTALADNPIIQTLYTADPAPVIWNNTLYLFTDHDENSATNNYNMLNWRLYSTTDMVNYLDLGSPASLTSTFPAWASGSNAWAPQVIPRNGKFYMYAPIGAKQCYMGIGVAVADKITGPYKDALGHPLICDNQFDPTVFIDPNDNQAYLYWGNPDLNWVKLNQDMISYSGSPSKINLTPSGFGTRDGSNSEGYQEGPWLYKRGNLWYMVYAGSCCSENIRYATAPTATGPWTYGGVVMPTQGQSFTNHPGVIDYKNGSYFFYHNAALSGSGYKRSVAVEKFTYGSNGQIPSMSMTSGPPQIENVNPYQRVEAELIAYSKGVSTETCSAGGQDIGSIQNGAYVKVGGVDFGSGAKSFTASVASANNGGSIQIRTGSTSGTVAGTCNVSNTGGWQTWKTVTCNVSNLSGVKDVYFTYTGGSGYLFNVDYWQFTKA